MNVIDFRVRLRTEQMLKPWNPKDPAPHFEQYIDFYRMEPRLSVMAMSDFVGHMNDEGISKAVVCGGNIEDNDHLMEVKESDLGEHFFFVAGIHPDNGIKRNMEECERIKSAGFMGISMTPCITGYEANSKTMYPIYSFCETHNLIAIVHGSLHYNRYQSMWLGDPKYMDEIAMNFPELKLVISHACNGFGMLGLAVAQKHPNIFLEFSALWPKYLPEPAIQAVNSYLKDRCLFGTDYPLVEFQKGREAWEAALRPEVHELFFEKNAERCLFGDPV